jgi:hypothetical protein
LLAPLLPFSFLFLPSFSFLFSLSSPPLTVFFFPKTDLGKDVPGRWRCGWYRGHLGSTCGLWARVKHPYCAQKPRNWSPGEAKTQKSTKYIVARKLRNKKQKIRTMAPSVASVNGGSVTALCTAEVWATSSFLEAKNENKSVAAHDTHLG